MYACMLCAPSHPPDQPLPPPACPTLPNCARPTGLPCTLPPAAKRPKNRTKTLRPCASPLPSLCALTALPPHVPPLPIVHPSLPLPSPCTDSLALPSAPFIACVGAPPSAGPACARAGVCYATHMPAPACPADPIATCMRCLLCASSPVSSFIVPVRRSIIESPLARRRHMVEHYTRNGKGPTTEMESNTGG